jgi:cell division protein FtsA
MVALEIGTSKVIALVGEMREDGNIMIIGTGECPSKGVRKGEVTEMESAAGCVRTALERAEETSGVRIGEVLVCVSGGHIQSVSHGGTVPVSGRDGTVDAEDVAQVSEVARAISLPDEREIIHSLSRQFSLDDQDRVIRPEGLAAARLTHEMLIVHGVRNRLENNLRAVQGLPMDIQDVAFSGLCSALAVMSPEQRKSGCLVMDFGAGTTDYMVYAGTVPAAAGVLAVGGDHVTNDIALAFGISTPQADRLKREFASALTGTVPRSQRVSLVAEVGFPARSVSLSSINTVVAARVEEVLSIIRARLERDEILPHLGAGVLLTGGGARLKGLLELTERIMGLPCQLGLPRNIAGKAMVSDSPELSTCVGLVQYGFKEHAERRREPVFSRWLKGLGLLGRGKT